MALALEGMIEMDIMVVMSLMVLGMAAVSGVSSVLYRRLPAAVFESSARHGRYAGLGRKEFPAGNPVGSSTMHGAHSLRGQRV